MENGTFVEASEAELRNWIREHRVCWQTVIHREQWQHRLRTVGYDIALFALCLGSGPWDPAGPRALEMHAELRRLAHHVLPRVTPNGGVSLSGFEPVLRLRPQTGWAPEARLVIEVRHEEADYFAPVDREEEVRRAAVENALAHLGVQRETWRDTPDTRTVCVRAPQPPPASASPLAA